MVQYKWIALSNTTLGVLMATINSTIILISLPAIFRGININPLASGSFAYLLWILMGYMIVTAVLLVTFGRLSDIFGRTRLYTIGFIIFTIGSILLYVTPNTGNLGAMELIVFRLIQGAGAAFLFSNSAAILTDAFPYNERGKAIGINMISGLAGSLIGLILGGILSVFNWRYVFLVSVPVGIIGSVWSVLKLKDNSVRHKDQKLDYVGTVLLGGGLTIFLIGITYGLIPYGSSDMGWSSPFVIITLIVGAVMVMAFPFVENHIKQPMFDMKLFRNRAFAFGNYATLLGTIGYGGAMFMLIILLQGIWLPLHGYSYASVPFWAGIYMIPMMAGFLIMGPIGGALTDRFGARVLATLGMVVVAVSFLVLATFSYNFGYLPFAITIFVLGLGNGLFAAPNSTAIMNSLPAQQRGVGSGMRATMQNTGQTASMGIFFTILIVSMAAGLTGAFTSAMGSVSPPLTQSQSVGLAQVFGSLPPTGALFSAFLGYNPVSTILGTLSASGTFSSLLPAQIHYMEGLTWFPKAIAPAVMSALRLSFYFGAIMAALAAVFSVLRGKTFIYELNEKTQPEVAVKNAPETASLKVQDKSIGENTK
ncbi:putative transporter [Thermoplasmatales archaeon]|nr:putative transporter [Thermoplasmatales archaeon]